MAKVTGVLLLVAGVWRFAPSQGLVLRGPELSVRSCWRRTTWSLRPSSTTRPPLILAGSDPEPEASNPVSPRALAARAESRRLSFLLWRYGWISWWAQTILSVVSSITLIFANAVTERSARGNPMTNGLAFSSCGILVSFVSIFWTWGFTRLANSIRLRKVDPLSVHAKIRSRVRKGIILNMVGQFFTLLSAEQIVGLLIARVLSVQGLQQFGTTPFGAPYGVTSSLRALDIFIVQANTNTLLSHFLSLAITMWLSNKLLDPSKATPVATGKASTQ